MDWINIGKQVGKLRQRLQKKRQVKPQKTAPKKTSPQYSQQAKNAKIKANQAKQKPVEKVANMPKAKQQAKAVQAQKSIQAKAKDAKKIDAPVSGGSSYKPKGVTPPQRSKAKEKGRSL